MQSRSIVVVLTLVSAAVAQTNPFIVFPQDPERQAISAASYVRRPSWNLAAEGLQEISNSFRGVGDQGGTCLVYGFYHYAADEQVSTSETYGIVLRSGSGLGIGPTPGTAGEIVRVSGLTTPVGAAGRGSWIMIDTFATPAVVPCVGEWFQGIDLPANANWPASDGHSLWSADMPGISPATVGENPRAGAQLVTWSLSPSGTLITTPWTCIMGSLVATPTLHVGGVDPNSARQGASGGANIGMGGMFPDIGGAPRRDGLVLRVHDNAFPSGISFVLGGSAYASTPFPVSPLLGQVHIDPSVSVSLGFMNLTGGAGQLTLAQPGSINTSFVGLSFMFQAVVFDTVTGAASFTNAQMTSL